MTPQEEEALVEQERSQSRIVKYLLPLSAVLFAGVSVQYGIVCQRTGNWSPLVLFLTPSILGASTLLALWGDVKKGRAQTVTGIKMALASLLMFTGITANLVLTLSR